jgi:predicted DNA-binding transcriptional regulator YafY
MTQTVLDVLTTAIKERRCVAIRYRDQHQIRVLEPHAIYRDENGEIVADCFQTRGYSSGGRMAPFWRPFRLKKISAASLLQESFTPRLDEGFSPSKLKYKNGLIKMVAAEARTEEKRFVYPYEMAPPHEMGPFRPKSPQRR